MKTTVLYHANCQDGFGAAFAAWLKLKDQATYIPVSYNKPPPDIEPCDRLYILDFSYAIETLMQLASKAKQVIILDHHRTAEADLKDLTSIDYLKEHPEDSGVFVKFDKKESGATLAWEYFHSPLPLPLFFEFIRDRDLWLWELEGSREFSAGLFSYPQDFTVWYAFLCDTTAVDRLQVDGAAILRAQRQRVENICRHPKFIEIGGHIVPYVNATSDFSEVGEYLCEQYPDHPFAASFSMRDDGKLQWSLRSRNGFDVSAIAKQFGGGGHQAAAGFVTEAPDVNPKHVDNP